MSCSLFSDVPFHSPVGHSGFSLVGQGRNPPAYMERFALFTKVINVRTQRRTSVGVRGSDSSTSLGPRHHPPPGPAWCTWSSFPAFVPPLGGVSPCFVHGMAFSVGISLGSINALFCSIYPVAAFCSFSLLPPPVYPRLPLLTVSVPKRDTWAIGTCVGRGSLE